MDLPFRVLGLLRGRCAQVSIFQGPLALTTVSWAGHLEVLKLLVARGADVMCKDKKGYTLLHTAAASGQIEVVRHLLRLGVEVRPLWLQAGWAWVQAGLETGVGEGAGWWQEPWLLLGCLFFFLNPQILWGLLLPQIDEPNSFGNTALHIACYMGQDAVANELVNYGANVNQPNEKGFTPLHFAAVSTNGALCLELLVNNGADVNFQVWR